MSPSPPAADINDTMSELEEALLRYPADRYPIQHATACYHLGVVLTNAGRVENAERKLRIAIELFDPDVLPREHATALNAMGAALRLQGRADEAAISFLQAAELFEKVGADIEEGAAFFNRGLALREAGDLDGSGAAFAHARTLLDPARVPAQAAATAREVAATLLSLGSFEEAAEASVAAQELSERAGDLAGLGAAENILGLIRLAQDRIDDAIAGFRDAAGANPRSVRPEGFAMAKANLALAYERAGDKPRARLSALQAAATPGAPDAVVSQTKAVLDRLGRQPGDVLQVLETEPNENWGVVMRDELTRWAASDSEDAAKETAAWIDGQLSRLQRADDLAGSLVGALLEMPSQTMEAVCRSIVAGLAHRDEVTREAFQSQINRALARFHVPQWMRLRDILNRASIAAGQDPSWS